MGQRIFVVSLLLIFILSISMAAVISDIQIKVGDVGTPQPVQPEQAKSVAYYTKLINKQIVENNLDFGQLTKEDLDSLKNKETGKTSVKSDKTVEFDGINEIKWSGILDSGDSTVSFNKVKISDKEYQLSVIFVDSWRRWLGFKPIEVKVNGNTVPCNSRWSVGLNASINQLIVASPLETEEICKYQVGTGADTEYVLYVSALNKVGSKYEMTVKSPLIPKDCPDEIVGSQDITKPVC
jgi:hypothetical protein